MILCDREADLAMDQGRVVIHPRPGPLFTDSTAIDLRLDGTLDRWEFPIPKAGLGQKPPMFCPGDVFADQEVQRRADPKVQRS